MEFFKENQTLIIVGALVLLILLYLGNMYIQNAIDNSLLPIKKKLKKLMPIQNPNPNQIINQEMPKPDTKKQEELDTEIIEKSEGDADSYYDPTKL